MRRIDRTARWIGWLLLPLMGLAIYGMFLLAPTEKVQGDVQRIFYFHVPMAWVAYLAFLVVFVCGIAYLLTRREGWDLVARCSAEVGIVFTTLVLITGSLWGKPIWGTWWTWDARLTSTLVLWFIYVGYLMLRAYAGDDARAARYAAIVGIVGFIDVPIVHMSVTWWRTLHPEPVVIRGDAAPALPPIMLAVLMVALVAFTLFYAYLMLMRVSLEQLRESVAQLRDEAMLEPDRAGSPAALSEIGR